MKWALLIACICWAGIGWGMYQLGRASHVCPVVEPTVHINPETHRWEPVKGMGKYDRTVR